MKLAAGRRKGMASMDGAMTGKGSPRSEPGARRVTWAPRKVEPAHEYDGVFFYPGGQMVITNPNLKHFIVIVEKDRPDSGDQVTVDYRC